MIFEAECINSLEKIFLEWLEIKKGTVLEKEIKRFQVNFYNLPKELQNMPINEIKAIHLDKLMKKVKPRKYEELRTLFNGIFKYAVASGILANNPVSLIPFKKAERQSKDALPTQEITDFFDRLKQPKYDDIRQGMYLLYFFGLRPCEVDFETHKENDFLITRNRKRKKRDRKNSVSLLLFSFKFNLIVLAYSLSGEFSGNCGRGKSSASKNPLARKNEALKTLDFTLLHKRLTL